MKDIENLAVKKLLILAAVVLLSALAVVNLNHISKTRLVNRTGQSFETGVVVRILEDNIQEDGMRVGVRMTSGEKKGQELITTSSAGYLFGAACTVGMRVVVIQSIAGDSVITSIYSRDRTAVMIGFAVLYLAILCIVGGKKGLRGALGLVFTFGAIVYVYLPAVYLGNSPFWTAVFICAVTGRKDTVRYCWDVIGSNYCRLHSYCFFTAFRNYRMECIRHRKPAYFIRNKWD